jgi:D-amino-acid dehydrogenase
MASLDLYRELATLPGLDFAFHEGGSMVVFLSEAALQHGADEARLVGEFGVAAKVLDGPAARAVEPTLRPEVAGGVLFPEDASIVPDRFVRAAACIVHHGKGVDEAMELLKV